MISYRTFCALFIVSVSIFKANAYDIGCIYPEDALDPWLVREKIGNWYSGFHNPTIDYATEEGSVFSDSTETPMVIRDGLYWSGCQTTCLHYHDDRVSDPFTKEPLGVTLPPDIQNAFSITMCFAQCYAHFATSWGKEVGDDYVEYAKDYLGIPITHPDPNSSVEINALKIIEDATNSFYDDGNIRPLVDLLVRYDFHPYIFGHVAGFRVMLIADNDGWNPYGALEYSREEQRAVPCNANCRTYQDTIGYAPKPNPRTYPQMSTDDNKYDCTGNCRRWQPLQEGTEKGSLKRQEFVVPHIGQHARTYLRNVTSDLVDPAYNYREESLKVIEEVRMTASSDYKKGMIRFFDDKLQVRALIRQNMRDDEYFRPAIPFQDYILFVYGMTLAEYDAVIQAWHEKERHDLVRPTTVIKHWDNDMLYTFGGDIDHNMPVDIRARDFEALIRVMPHPEFPSGSSCLCVAYSEYVDSYTSFYHNGRRLEDIKTLTVEYGDQVTFADLSEVSEVCGESRIWAGIHYEAAVPAGVQACEGLGRLALEWVDELKNTEIPYVGREYGRDDPPPRCMNRMEED